MSQTTRYTVNTLGEKKLIMAEAGLPGTLEHLKEYLTCSVCSEEYTNPRTLPCNHSFCLDCIEQLLTEAQVNICVVSCCYRLVVLLDYSFRMSSTPLFVQHAINNHNYHQNQARDLPRAFHINGMLDLQAVREDRESCPEHNDPLKVYCETCHEVICRDCAISERHNKHDFRLVSNIFPRHLELIKADLQQSQGQKS